MLQRHRDRRLHVGMAEAFIMRLLEKSPVIVLLLLDKNFEFRRVDEARGGGISVTITFRYLKGCRIPYVSKSHTGQRDFNILPLNVIALAFSRGLFTFGSVSDLFNANLRIIPQVPEGFRLPVFAKSNQAGELSSKPMHDSTLSLDPKLRETCTMIGLLARNSMYSSYDSGSGDVDFSNIHMGLLLLRAL
jgi:hypothetical protein